MKAKKLVRGGQRNAFHSIPVFPQLNNYENPLQK